MYRSLRMLASASGLLQHPWRIGGCCLTPMHSAAAVAAAAVAAAVAAAAAAVAAHLRCCCRCLRLPLACLLQGACWSCWRVFLPGGLLMWWQLHWHAPHRCVESEMRPKLFVCRGRGV
jgi:hypothetical protein